MVICFMVRMSVMFDFIPCMTISRVSECRNKQVNDQLIPLLLANVDINNYIIKCCIHKFMKSA